MNMINKWWFLVLFVGQLSTAHAGPILKAMKMADLDKAIKLIKKEGCRYQ